MNFLLDANTFVEAKNRYYNMTVCPAYWSWILQKHAQDQVASISMIGDELKAGDDELAAWAKNNPQLFLDVADVPTQECFSAIADYVAAQAGKMKTGAVEDFLSGADPWLVAKAMNTGCVVVTA